MPFKIDWASLIVGSESTVFALFYFVFEGNFPSTSPRGAYIWRGNLTEGFLRYRFGGLVHGGAYFRNFTVCLSRFLSIPPTSLSRRHHDVVNDRMRLASVLMTAYITRALRPCEEH